MGYGSAMESQVKMAEAALSDASARGGHTGPAPTPQVVTQASPCASAVNQTNPHIDTGKAGGRQ
jgi:hypothetical protein